MFRSWLCCSVLNTALIEKAQVSGAGVVHFDLEDSVPNTLKEAARNHLKQAFELNFSCQSAVRINDIRIEDGQADVQFMKDNHIYPDIIILPKHLYTEAFPRLVDFLKGANKHIKLFSIVESIEDLIKIKRFEPISPRLSGLILGVADLAYNYGCSAFELDTFPIKYDLSVYAKQNNLILIDSPCFDIHNIEKLTQETLSAKHLGFDAKIAIHPNHVPIINKIMGPSSEQLDFARKIISKSTEDPKTAVFQVNHKMIGPPMVSWAKKLISEYEENNEKTI
jgi:(S)-citramalyl-CoA lyase